MIIRASQLIEDIIDAFSYAKKRVYPFKDIKERFKTGNFGFKIYTFLSALRFNRYRRKNSSVNEFTIYKMKSCFGHDGIKGRKMPL